MRPRAKNLVRRCLTTVTLYLLSGILLSVAVAWIAPAVGPTHALTTADMAAIERDGLHLAVMSSHGGSWAVLRFITYPDEEQARWSASHGWRDEISTRPIPCWANTSLDANASELRFAPAVLDATLTISAVGWPSLCLKGTQMRLMTNGGPARLSDEGLLRLGNQVMLCFLPVWPGLLLNSVVFGASLFVGRWGVRAFIRRVRSSRNRCPSCGYDRRGLVGDADAKCPECGTVPGKSSSL
jgi:hypothetical protein